MSGEQYLLLDQHISDGESLHPEVATEDYGFPPLTTPGSQVYVVPIPEEIAESIHGAAYRILIFQAIQFKNGHRSWIRLRSYACTVAEK
jgi:hypothetical protein